MSIGDKRARMYKYDEYSKYFSYICDEPRITIMNVCTYCIVVQYYTYARRNKGQYMEIWPYAVPAVGCRNCIIVPRSWPPCPRHGPGGSPPPGDGLDMQPCREPFAHTIKDIAIHNISMLLQKRQQSQRKREE